MHPPPPCDKKGGMLARTPAAIAPPGLEALCKTSATNRSDDMSTAANPRSSVGACCRGMRGSLVLNAQG
eukprot:1157429-Pelagomonas_calceolata.AAC.2